MSKLKKNLVSLITTNDSPFISEVIDLRKDPIKYIKQSYENLIFDKDNICTYYDSNHEKYVTKKVGELE